MSTTINRRYDIDWVRVIAIGLLLLYHVAIGFQSWGIMIGFIANSKSWESLWLPMSMLNVWRIPLLFFVSGMGVYFALQRRSFKQLIGERGKRIFLPYVFGIFVIVPIHVYLWKRYYNMPIDYNPNPGHLWFLGNIFAYVLIWSPLFFYLKKHEEGKLVQGIKKVLSNPFGLLVVIAALIAEVLIVNPNPYEMYAMTWHGFFLGMIAFFFGFCFVLAGDPFWKMMLKYRWMFLAIAIGLFVFRFNQFQMRVPMYLLPIESCCWIFSVLAFAHRYLNHGGCALRYLSQAAYPVYIIHMIFLYLGSYLVFPLNISVQSQFVLVLLFTFSGCMVTYELVIRRIPFVGLLFGVTPLSRPKEESVSSSGETLRELGNKL